MAESAEIQAALAWAGRVERGEVAQDSYIVALKNAYLDLQHENEELHVLLGIREDDTDAWRHAARLQRQVVELEQRCERLDGAGASLASAVLRLLDMLQAPMKETREYVAQIERLRTHGT